MGSISPHITPFIIYSPGVDMHTYTPHIYTHIHITHTTHTHHTYIHTNVPQLTTEETNSVATVLS